MRRSPWLGRGAALAAFVAGSLALGGCGAGGAPKEAEPPPPAYQQQEYPRSEHPASQQQPYGQPGYAPAPTATAQGPMDFSQPPEPNSLAEWEAYFDRNASALATDFQCLDACRALQSLERAQKRICEILAEDDPEKRCERARQRVAAAKSRVETQCQCTATP